jgi:hypothetical protein
MKRILSIFLVVSMLGIIASCKPKEKCPAYGKYQPAKSQSAS